MVLAWILVLITLMAGSKAGRKLKQAKNKKNVERFNAGDFGLSDSEACSIDWDTLGSDDDDELEAPAVKEEPTEKPSSPTIMYTRRRSARSSGVRFNESTAGIPMD